MTFAVPQALWLLALLPAVVALHFLRARRRRRDVAGLFLWRRAHAHVARKRRYSPTWLLALQLLFVAAAAVAMAGPRLARPDGGSVVLVLDASASMAARSGGGTRLDLAVAAALDRLGGRSRVALVRAGAAPRLLAPLDATRADLLAALSEVRAFDAREDLLGAVDLGRSLLPGAPVVVFTDHRAELGRAEVVVVGEAVDNLGISAFDVGVGQAFVAVVASGSRPAEAVVGLFDAGKEVARTTVLVPAGGSGSATFPLLDELGGPTGVLEARILAPGPDALDLDDRAFAGRRELAVVTDDLYAPLVRALQAAPGVALYGAADATRRVADLRVVTRALDDGDVDSLPAGDYLLFQPPARAPEYHVVRDQDRVAPLMRFVELESAVVGLDPAREGWRDLDGWQVLARAEDLTPLLRLRRTPSGSVLQFAFHPSQSDLVLRPAFPALLANWLALLGETPRLSLGDTLPGWTGPARAPGVYDLATGNRVTDAGQVAPGEGAQGEGAPGGGAPGGRGAARGATGGPAPALRSEPVALASLLSAPESSLGGPAPTQPGEGRPRAAASPAAAAAGGTAEGLAGNSLTPLALALLSLAGLALIVEWWLYAWRRGGGLVGWRS